MNPTVVFEEPGRVVIQDRVKPVPGAQELLIKTRCTLVSTGTELTILSGEFPPDSTWSTHGRFPFLPGYDNIGDVVGVGDNVDRQWLGQRVATYSYHARYVCAPANTARVVHRAIPDEQAAFFTIAEIVMNGIRRGKVQWGEAVVIYGLGLLGQLAVRICRLCGARPVVAVDLADSRLELLPRDAAVIPVNAARGEAAAVIGKLTRGRKADVVFEVTGNPDAILEQVPLLHPLGRLVVLSSPRGPTRFDFHDLCNAPSIAIIGAHNESHPRYASEHTPWTQLRHAELFFDLVADGELVIEPLISHNAHFTEAPYLYDRLLQDRSPAMGVCLRWTE